MTGVHMPGRPVSITTYQRGCRCDDCRAVAAASRARSRANRPCTIDGCDDRVAARGLCHRHYESARATGRLVSLPGLVGEVRIDGDRWRARAACIGEPTDVWFPERESWPTQPAADVCNTCPVAEQCLEYALVNNIGFGVWGGLPTKARLAIRRERRRATEAASS